MELLRGVLLIPSQDYVCLCTTHYSDGLEAYDLDVPGGIDCLAQRLEPLFLDQPLTQELLSQLKEEIVRYYRDCNRPVVAVYVPEQTLEHNVLKMVVIEGCVGSVAASGCRWFSSWLYESFVRLSPGDVITEDTLLTDVAWLNRNPFRNVDVIFTPGCELGMTNIELVVRDRCPIQVCVGADNTGSGPTGHGRVYTGVTWGNALWLDHIASYQYTTSPDFDKFHAHNFHYTAPLLWRHLLLLFGGYSAIEPISGGDQNSRQAQLKGSNGSFFQGSVRYVVPFGYRGSATIQQWSVGFDYKYYDNKLFFTDKGSVAGGELAPANQHNKLTQANRPIDLSQFVVGLAYASETERHRLAVNVDLYGSPGKLFPHETNERYQEISPRSQVRYLYGKLTVGDTVTLPWGFTGALLGRMQLASHNLLPSERFGLGGFDTVRGYSERIFNVDDAFVFNAELRTPPVSLLKLCGGTGRFCDRFLLLAFYDYAIGGETDRKIDSTRPYEGASPSKTNRLMSFGPGMRYTIDRFFSLRADWGIKLCGASELGDKARSRWHVGIVLSY